MKSEKLVIIFTQRGKTDKQMNSISPGEAMSLAAREFAEDPCSSMKRGNMVRAARNLLSAVTRLLILADMVDVHLLLKSLQVVGTRI
jgi:hypothetical protein